MDEVAGRCGFRSPVALRGHFRRQLGSSPAAYRAAYRARRPQGDRAVDPEPSGGPRAGAPPEPAPLSPENGVPFQTRRTASPMPATAGSLPGQRSAP